MIFVIYAIFILLLYANQFPKEYSLVMYSAFYDQYHTDAIYCSLQRFTNKHPFSEDEIDDIRRLWANYLLEVANA